MVLDRFSNYKSDYEIRNGSPRADSQCRCMVKAHDQLSIRRPLIELFSAVFTVKALPVPYQRKSVNAIAIGIFEGVVSYGPKV